MQTLMVLSLHPMSLYVQCKVYTDYWLFPQFHTTSTPANFALVTDTQAKSCLPGCPCLQSLFLSLQCTLNLTYPAGLAQIHSQQYLNCTAHIDYLLQIPITLYSTIYLTYHYHILFLQLKFFNT